MSEDDKINIIDSKLDILLSRIDYKDYIEFIKDNKLLSTYDSLIGYIDINILPNELKRFLTDDVYNQIILIIEKKINSIN